MVDFKVAAEIEKFALIRAQILADGLKSEYYQNTTRFNLIAQILGCLQACAAHPLPHILGRGGMQEGRV